MAKKKLTDRAVEKALLANRGIVTEAAKALGVVRQTIAIYVKNSEHLQGVQLRATEELIDKAEGHLYTLIAEGNITALIYFLKTKGKHRGWAQDSHTAGVDDGAISEENSRGTANRFRGRVIDICDRLEQAAQERAQKANGSGV